MKTAEKPFHFVTRVNLTECTQWKAEGLADLLRHLKAVPESVIYYHTHHFLRQHQYLSPEPPNDFAYWVSELLGEELLGESLASVDVVHVGSLEELRAEFIRRLEEYFAQGHKDVTARPGEEFFFMQSVVFTLPTPYRAVNLAEFAEGLRRVSIHAIAHHVFDARLRNPGRVTDFSLWLSSQLGEDELARFIDGMDPYTQTLEGFRFAILGKIGERLTPEKNKNGSAPAAAAPLRTGMPV